MWHIRRPTAGPIHTITSSSVAVPSGAILRNVPLMVPWAVTKLAPSPSVESTLLARLRPNTWRDSLSAMIDEYVRWRSSSLGRVV